MWFMQPLSCLQASSHICSHPFPCCPITKHSQISPTASFQRQQFPRIFSRRQPVTGRRAASPRCPHPREVAWSHPWPGSRSPGCFSPVEEPHQPVSAPSWSSANYETQNCRKPDFTHSGSGIQRSTSWPNSMHCLGVHCTRDKVCSTGSGFGFLPRLTKHPDERAVMVVFRMKLPIYIVLFLIILVESKGKGMRGRRSTCPEAAQLLFRSISHKNWAQGMAGQGKCPANRQSRSEENYFGKGFGGSSVTAICSTTLH